MRITTSRWLLVYEADRSRPQLVGCSQCPPTRLSPVRCNTASEDLETRTNKAKRVSGVVQALFSQARSYRRLPGPTEYPPRLAANFLQSHNTRGKKESTLSVAYLCKRPPRSLRSNLAESESSILLRLSEGSGNVDSIPSQTSLSWSSVRFIREDQSDLSPHMPWA